MIDKIEIERITVEENHEAYPLVVYYIKSGFPDKFIQITEDPFNGQECELVTESEKVENIKKLEQDNMSSEEFNMKRRITIHRDQDRLDRIEVDGKVIIKNQFPTKSELVELILEEIQNDEN